jgi:hypothetical protein
LAFTLFFPVATSLMQEDRAGAYVLPSQQILQFVSAHFSKFETLVIKHTVERESGVGVQSFEEILTMKSPDFLHAAPTEESGTRTGIIDRSFRALFLASSQTWLRDLLSGAGVDLDRVSYTRIDGTVAYLIGEGRDDRPKLAVEKARFLPLVFNYPSRLSHDPEFIRVTFRDYRQVGQGWYPFEIMCSSDAGWVERYKVQSIQVNAPVQPSLFQPSQSMSRPAKSACNEEKIHANVRAFERKYVR